MLDSKARKFVQPLISGFGDRLLKLGLTANGVTWIAFLVGIFSGVFVYFGEFLLAIIFLWLSGFLDAVDGSMARESGNTSSWGTLMDITFDRFVEVSFIIALALKFPDIQFYFILMTCSIILSMTIFLTVGNLSKKEGIKSFYYQAGFAERTEGFILFTLMLIFPDQILGIAIFYAVAVFFTALQRMAEAKRLLGNNTD